MISYVSYYSIMCLIVLAFNWPEMDIIGFPFSLTRGTYILSDCKPKGKKKKNGISQAPLYGLGVVL